MNGHQGRVLYYYDLKPITQADIENALIDAGLKKGDMVFVHSDIGTIGKIGDIKDRNEFCESILKAFFHVIGNTGTLFVPTYTYSFCKNEDFDVKKSKSTVGIFSEYVRSCKGAVRSEDPIFSHAGIGIHAADLLENVGNVCFGKDSFFDRFNKRDGKIINFGKFFDITFIHYIENAFQVDYRYNKKFQGTVIREDGSSYKTEFVFYVRCLPEEGKEVIYDITLLGDEMEKQGLLKRVSLGNEYILCSRVRDCYIFGLAMLEKNEYAFLKKKP